jgi:ABC-2 type transport system ATP-binding protein
MDSYLAGMNAVEMCTYAGELGGLPRSEAMQRAHEALYYAGLEDKRYQKVDAYSTGQKQRVKLAQALVHDPELLFLDEPTNGLDPSARGDMLDLIADLPKRRKCSIILSTHLLPDVERVCNNVIIMQQGRLRFSGTMAALRGEGRGDRVVDVEVKADMAALADRLAAAGCEVERAPPVGMTVTLPADQDARMIFREARAAGAQVRHVATQTMSLEAAFLRELGAEP